MDDGRKKLYEIWMDDGKNNMKSVNSDMKSRWMEG